MEQQQVIPLSPTKEGIHPKTGRQVTVVGVDTSNDEPKLIILVLDINGIRAEVVYVDNRRP